ncbi:hypothetical protein N0V83_009188 [Neocucurbitaria cava]|uniref:Uncharacterized protein n=1 Tax=Neocucurbitaria cava TaxID=798079 RepID=A0A9W9CIW2_9PLEO|nr:hypothetical protein N0V83_009188 [Neocucurbitaria cava]
MTSINMESQKHMVAQPRIILPRGRPRKNPTKFPKEPQGGQGSVTAPLSASGARPSIDAEPKRKRGRPRQVAGISPSTPEPLPAERTEAPEALNLKKAERRPIQIGPRGPPQRGTFSGLRDEDQRSFTSLQIEKVQGHPEDVVDLTDSDEDLDESTDVEDGGFEEAEGGGKPILFSRNQARNSRET